MRVLTVRDVVRVTPRTRIIRIDIGDTRFPFRAGQAIVVGLRGQALRKPYSIACAPRQTAATGALELLVQIEEAGVPDPHLERLSPGDPVEVDGPFGTFTLPADLPQRDVLFVAGGTGVAPLRSMLWETIERGGDQRIAFVYSARGVDEFAYAEELRQLHGDGRIDLRMTITREGGGAWSGERGRIDAALIRSVLRSRDTWCAVCGPPAMVSAVIALLTDAGLSAGNIVSESFSA